MKYEKRSKLYLCFRNVHEQVVSLTHISAYILEGIDRADFYNMETFAYVGEKEISKIARDGRI